jgi:hypothetical protein
MIKWKEVGKKFHCVTKWNCEETKLLFLIEWIRFSALLFIELSLTINFRLSQKPQEALNLLVREERYWALFYMPLYTFYTIFLMYLYRSHIKWD